MGAGRERDVLSDSNEKATPYLSCNRMITFYFRGGKKGRTYCVLLSTVSTRSDYMQ